MSALIIATGSNLGDRQSFLTIAQQELTKHFEFEAASRIYVSKAVDYTQQPDFYNQVLQFKLPLSVSPKMCLETLLEIEKYMGRTRDVLRGPRTIDLDILFWGTESFNEENLTVPHPRWDERSFVVLPLQELPFFQTLKKYFTIPSTFTVMASPLS